MSGVVVFVKKTCELNELIYTTPNVFKEPKKREIKN